jgi:hypothetical protein
VTDASLRISVDSTDVNKAKKSLDDLALSAKGAESQTEGLGETTKQAGDEIVKSNKKSESSFGGMAATIGKVAAALGLLQVGRMFADTVMETEKLRGALTTMTGSTENAAAAFDNLTVFAAKTPFTLDQSVNAFIKLKALGLDPSERAMMSYGNTASAMGKDMMQMIEAVADASTGEFERLKEFGIKAKQEGDNVSLTFQGVTTTIGKNSDEIQAYLLAIGETQFAGAMENQMKRLPGLMSNLQDNIDGLFRKMGDTGGISLFGKAISLASGAVVLLTDNLDLIGTALGAAGAAFAVLAAPAAILGGIAMIQKAVIAMNAAILANPIAIVAASIGAAAYVIYKHWDTITDAAEKSAVAVQIAWMNLKLFLMETFSPVLTDISRLFTSARNTAVATWEAIAAAAKNPLNAIDTFNSTFDKTLTRLEAGQAETAVFSGAISETRASIQQMEMRMTEMNATTADAVVVLTEAATATDTATAAVVEMTAAEDDLTMAIMAKITELDAERAALHLSERELFILNATKLKGVELSYEQAAGIRDAAAALFDEREQMKESEQAQKALDDTRAKSIDVWTKLSTRGAEQRAEAEIEANRRTQENTQRTHEFITNSLLGIGESGGNVFKQIGDSFEAMVKRMVAEWAASKLMSLFGLGGTGAANPFAAIGSAVTNAIGGSAAGAAGGGGVAAAIGGGVKAVGSAVSGGLSSAGAAIAANPLLAGVGVAALAAAALAEKPTYSSNAGLLIHDAPGASADRKFAVSPFASGFAPVGFARREDQGAATAVIDVFRSYDASLTEIARAAGLNVNFSNNPFGGFDERGQGNGLFLGTAAEQGSGVTSASMSDQLTQFTKQWVEALGGQVSPADREFLLSSASADQLLERAATLGQAEAGRLNGSHFGGLPTVPFNGYRAELHRGEEVLRANDPRNQNNGGGMVNEMRSMLAEMRNMAFYTKRTADLLMRVTRDGDSLVTVAA